MTSEFEHQLDKYAQVILQVGLDLQPGDRLLIRLVPLELASLVHAIARRAYQSGARLVHVTWEDQHLERIRLQYAPPDTFEEYPEWRAAAAITNAQEGGPALALYVPIPGLNDDMDPANVATLSRVFRQHHKPYYDTNGNRWSMAIGPVPGWSEQVFPGVSPQEAEQRMWDALFKICRVTEDDPIAAWREHSNSLAAWAKYMTDKQYDALKYTGPGTDLTVGLAAGHIWKGGAATSGDGRPFVANVPTEEIFTLPDKRRVDGVVTATKPLNYAGSLIDGFSITFREGRAVEVSASSREDVLREMVAADEGAARLGEVALVPHSSPISQSGLLFMNTLLDENASSHLALGSGYRATIEGGTEMSEEEFDAAGGNTSVIHTDFMVGSDQMDVDGLFKDGSEEPVMRGGEWTFEV